MKCISSCLQRSRFLFPIAMLLVQAVIGCGGFRQSLDKIDIGPPGRILVEQVPFYPQTEFQCGPSSLAMVLGWSGASVSTEILSREIFIPEQNGSFQSLLISAARERGRVAYPIFGFRSLLENLRVGYPAIVLLNLGLSWFPVWHYAVVVGVDREKGVIFLHSGEVPGREMGIDVFGHTWKRGGYWGLLVLPPSLPPANPVIGKYLHAVVGLERTGRWKEAAIAYATLLKSFPYCRTAHIGLANSFYRMEQKERALTVLQQTTLEFPKYAVAFNNLAQVLYELGRRQEALKAARTAINLGGGAEKKFRMTLREIEKAGKIQTPQKMAAGQ